MLRCPACRTRRKDKLSLFQHIKASGHKPCNCGGYHYPHRPGSPCCDQNPEAVINDAKRRGASDEEIEDIRMDMILYGGQPGGEEPPF